MFEEEDRMQISKLYDSYCLTFIRNDKPLDSGFKSPTGIYVRLRTSGSRYDYFYIPFMRMYQTLQKVDEKYAVNPVKIRIKK